MDEEDQEDVVVNNCRGTRNYLDRKHGDLDGFHSVVASNPPQHKKGIAVFQMKHAKALVTPS